MWQRLRLLLSNRSSRYLDLNQTQQGSIIIPMVGIVFVGLVLLGSLHLGYLFYMKRELQNAADNAAKSGALELAITDCTHARQTAANIVNKDLGQIGLDQIHIECGVWNDQAATESSAFTADTSNPNAIQVRLGHRFASSVPYMDAGNLSATAVAAQQNSGLAVFSVGPQLLSLNAEQNGLLPVLLKNVGLDPNITLLDHRGLANINLTPAGLLHELGVEIPATITLASLHQVLDTEAQVFTFAEILNASIQLLQREGALDALSPNNSTALQHITQALSTHPSADTLVRLFDRGAGQYPSLFTIANLPSSPASPQLTTQSAGLNTHVQLEQILGLGLALASQNQALDLGLDLSFPPLLKATAKVGVIEPPVIAIGGNGTQAHSANIRAFIHLCAGVGCTNTSNLLNLKVDIPLVVEVMNATGTIHNICAAGNDTNSHLADIAIQSEVAGVCIGNFDLDSTDPDLHPFSYSQSCTTKIPSNGMSSKFDKEIIQASLLGLININNKSSLAISALKTSEPRIGTFLNTTLPQTIYVDTDPLNHLGTTVSHVTDVILLQLLSSLLGNEQFKNRNVAPSVAPQQIKELVDRHWTHAVQQGTCNVNSNNLSGSTCRKETVDRSIALMQAEADELGLYVSQLQSNSVLRGLGGTVGSLLTLNVTGVVSGLLSTVNKLLQSVLSGIVGLPTDQYLCNGTGGVLGLIGLGDYGSASRCKNTLQASIKDQNTSNQASDPNSLSVQSLGFIKQILDLLQLENFLNTLGERVLTPVLSEALGIKLGSIETTLHSIDCKPDVRLVY